MPRGLAIASLVLGVVGLPTGGLCIVGAVAGIGLGIAALVRASSPADGRDLAWAGLATNALALLASMPLFILVASLHRTGYFAWDDDALPEPATASWEPPEAVLIPPHHHLLLRRHRRLHKPRPTPRVERRARP